MSDGLIFISEDTKTIKAALIAAYEEITGKTVMPASPEYQYILWTANIIVINRIGINFAANQNIPKYASGEYLDALAELFHNITRKSAASAETTMQFNISAVQSTSILIPSGTRVTTIDKSVTFATISDVYITIGETQVEVLAKCETTGIIGNGFIPGQISQIVDLYDYYLSCANITTSDGGAEVESDNDLYERMRMSEDSYSTAGPVGAYEYWAKSVSTEIADVKAICPIKESTYETTIYDGHAFIGGESIDEASLVVYPHGSSTPATITTDYSVSYENELLDITINPEGSLFEETQIDVKLNRIKAGNVEIYAIMNDGTPASDTIKNKIYEACNEDTVRPLTDKVSVEDPEIVEYNIDLTYYIPYDSPISASDHEAAVASAVNQYKTWQSNLMGRDINPSYLIGLVMQTGVKRVVLSEPGYVVLSDGSDGTVPQIAVINTETITNGGYEHD